MLDYTRAWFKNYKIPDGKPANEFAFEGTYKSKAFALQIIQETGLAWENLVAGKIQYDAISTPSSIARTCSQAIQLNPEDALAMNDIKEENPDISTSYYGIMG